MPLKDFVVLARKEKAQLILKYMTASSCSGFTRVWKKAQANFVTCLGYMQVTCKVLGSVLRGTSYSKKKAQNKENQLSEV